MVWWLRIGAELSISAGKTMLQCFMNIKLPRLIVSTGWNYASYHPYFAAGPQFFCYTAPKTMDLKQALFSMFVEENEKADPDTIISKNVMQKIMKNYSKSYEEGRWLTRKEKGILTMRKKSML